MSWNIERLGDRGNLGKHDGHRPDDVIEDIAKIIDATLPDICALIEVFTANGIDEVDRIVAQLNFLGESHTDEDEEPDPTVWDWSFSGGTGGFTNADGDNEHGQEGYAILFQTSLGISCVEANGQWLDIFNSAGVEPFDVTSKGRTYLRDAFEFHMHINGSDYFEDGGEDLDFPVVVFHAPGPRDDPRRQFQIQQSITGLFAVCAPKNDYPNAFICADFNASEDAANLVNEAKMREIDFSFPGNLEYMMRLAKVLTMTELLGVWIEKNTEIPDIDSQAVLLANVGEFIEEYWDLFVRGKEDCLSELESDVEGIENWFLEQNQYLITSGIAAARTRAQPKIKKFIKAKVESSSASDRFIEEKQLFRIWKAACETEDEGEFFHLVARIEDSEGPVFAMYITTEEPPEDMPTLQAIVRAAFEDEFEDIESFQRSRSIGSYTKKIVEYTIRTIRDMLANEKLLDIQDDYEIAFSGAVDSGFFESTSYDDSLLTTRRRSILSTDIADQVGAKWRIGTYQDDDSVRCSNYDQILPRIDADRFGEPEIEVISVFECVTPGRLLGLTDKPYVELDRILSSRSYKRLFVKTCVTAKEAYNAEIKVLSSKPDWRVKARIIARVVGDLDDGESRFCCDSECIRIEDLKQFDRLQAFLTRSNELSDHDPVLLTADFYRFTLDDEASYSSYDSSGEGEHDDDRIHNNGGQGYVG